MNNRRTVVGFILKILCSFSILLYPLNSILDLNITDQKVEAAGSQFTLPTIPTPRSEVSFTAGTTATVSTPTAFVLAYKNTAISRIVMLSDITLTDAQVQDMYNNVSLDRSLQIDGQGFKLLVGNFTALVAGIFRIGSPTVARTLHFKNLNLEKTTGANAGIVVAGGTTNWDIIYEDFSMTTGVNFNWVNVSGNGYDIFLRNNVNIVKHYEDTFEGLKNLIFAPNSNVFLGKPVDGAATVYDPNALINNAYFGANSTSIIEGSNSYPAFFQWENFDVYPGANVTMKKQVDLEGVLDGYGITGGLQRIRVDTNAKFALTNQSGPAYYDWGNPINILGNPGSDIRFTGNYGGGATTFVNANSKIVLNSPGYFDFRNENNAYAALYTNSASATGAFQFVDTNIGAWAKSTNLNGIPTTPAPFNNVSLFSNDAALLAGATPILNTMPGGWATNKYARIAYSERPTVTATNKTLGVSQVATINPTFSPANSTVTYLSNNTGIATVNTSGDITGVSVGSTTVQISVTNAEGVTTTTNITVTVTNNPPTLTVNPQFIETPVNGPLNIMQGVSATDTEDGTITGNIVTTGSVNTSIAGVYNINYSITDSNNNTTTANRVVLVNDGTYVVGTNYILRAVNFTKRISEVDLSQSAIKTAASAVAYKKSDATVGTVDITSTGGYGPTVGTYTIGFAVNGEPATTRSITATVATGNLPTVTATPSIVTVNVGDTVNPLTGVVGSDTEDGSLTPTHNGPVNTTATGVQIVTYTVVDSDGNTATTNRTYVIVSPTEPAVIGTTHVIFAKDFSRRVGQVVLTPGDIITAANARVYRLSDGALGTVGIVAINGYGPTVGTYEIEYEAVEDNLAKITIDASVVTGNLPQLTVTNPIVTVNVGDIINPLTGVTASDTEDGVLIPTHNGPVNTTTTGVKVITYNVTDSDGNTATATRTYVIVSPDEPAVIGINYVIFANAFSKRLSEVDTADAAIQAAANARAYKISDGSIQTVTTTATNGYTAALGAYQIDFAVTLEPATTISATATVNNGNIPTITITPAVLTVNVGDTVNPMIGVTGSDVEDGVLIPSNNGPVNTSTTGVQVITYTVTDSDGNTFTKTRAYVIVSTEEPAVIGTEYAIFSKNFTKRVSEVDVSDAAIIAAANARAFKLSDGTSTAVGVVNKNGYTATASNYTIDFAVTAESTTTQSIVATVTNGAAPVITVTPTVLEVTLGDTVDLKSGVSASDTEDGTIAASNITTTISGNMNATGVAVVTYSVTDTDGNTATSTRTYIISSLTDPAVIGTTHVLFGSDFTKRVGQVNTAPSQILIAANARAYRLSDGALATPIVTGTNGYGPIVNSYAIGLSVVQEATLTKTITATVTAGNLPTLTITPGVEVVNVGDTVNILTGVSSTDIEDGTLTPTNNGPVNTTATGVQVVTYNVVDSDGNTATGKRTYVIVSPDEPAVVGTDYIIFASPFTLRVGQVNVADAAIQSKAKARAFKISDGTTASVSTIATGGYAPTVGTYTLEFSVANELATSITSLATVIAGEIPTLNIVSPIVTVNVGDSVNPLVGVTATDTEDGALAVSHNGPINTTATGVQVVTYSATDSDGNTATGKRTYVIVSPDEPAVVGTDYVIFASDFTKRVSLVDIAPAAITLSANARAFKLSDGTSTTVNITNANGYGPIVNTYIIEFEVASEPATTITANATVETGQLPILDVAPELVQVSIGDTVSIESGVTATDTEDGTLVFTNDGPVNTTQTGVQIVTYSTVDSDGNTVSKTRTYVISSVEVPAVIGTDYVIFAGEFVRRVGVVDTAPAAIITAANARAFALADGAPATVTVNNTGGYTNVIGVYPIQFGVAEEITLTTGVNGTVIAGNEPVLTVTPAVVSVNVGDVVDPMIGVSATDVEDVSLTITNNGPVDTSDTGVQIVRYSVTDTDGNNVVMDRTYIITSSDIKTTVGTEYVIFANDFSKRIAEVDTSTAAMVTAANVRAFRLGDGLQVAVGVQDRAGYSATLGIYPVVFEVQAEATTVTINASVTAGDVPVLTITPAVKVVNVGDVVNELDGVTATDTEDVIVTPTSSGTVNTSVTGVKVITYTATDSDGNTDIGTRTYVIVSPEEPAVVGTNYVIFASSFTKRIGQVDTTASAIKTATNVRAFRLSDGTPATYNLLTTNGYAAVVGTYNIEFEVENEPTVTITPVATVITGAVPTITATPAVVTVNVGDTVNVMNGVVASDTEDAVLSPTNNGPVNTAATGVQVITYTVVDSDGNTASTKRTYVIVSDDEPAVVGTGYVVFASPFTKRVGQVDTSDNAVITAANARAFKLSDGTAGTIQVDTNGGYSPVVNNYTITFGVVEESLLTIDSIATVVTGGLPTLTITPSILTVNVGDTVNPLLGVTVTDAEDTSLTPTHNGPVNTSSTGVQVITYSFTDTDGNTVSGNRTYVIVSAEQPAVIGTDHVIFASNFTRRVGQVDTSNAAIITAANAKAFAISDGSAATVQVSSTGGYAANANTYTITYSVAEETTLTMNATATVTAGQNPVVTITPTVVVVNVADVVDTSIGVSGSDVEDGILTPVASGLVNTSSTGVQVITYTATDSDGNSTSAKRTYVVVSPDEPAIVGTTHVIFASPFTKRVGEVNTGSSAIIAAANARAFRLSDGGAATALIEATGGYGTTPGTYAIEFKVAEEPTTKLSAAATVTTGAIPIIGVTPKVVTVLVGDVVDTSIGVTASDTEDGALVATANTAVNTAAAGVQIITYSVTDSDNNTVTEKRTYVIVSADEPATVGTDYVIFASNFTKRISQVDVANNAVITAANARAFKLADGSTAAVELTNGGGYGAVANTYTLVFGVVAEPATAINASATVTIGTIPVITMSPSILTVNKNSTVNLLSGIVGTDAEDGLLTVSTTSLDTAITGVQIVTYSVTDSDGNTVTATRTFVIVSPDEPAIVGTDYVIFASNFTKGIGQVDTTPAVITAAAKARAFKISDGSVSSVNLQSDGGYTAALGTYTLTFNVIGDSTATITSTATVTSGNSPEIFVSPTVVSVNVGDTVDVQLGVSASDTEDGVLTVSDNGPLDTSTSGVRNITYTAVDSDYNTTIATRTYVITSPTERAVIGANYVVLASDFTKRAGEVNVNPNAIIASANARAFRIADALPAVVEVGATGGYGPTVGTYTIQFVARDENTVTIDAIATVQAGTLPTITMIPEIVEVNVGDSVNVLDGVTGSDAEDGSLVVSASGPLNTTSSGVQAITYSVTDSDFNTVTAKRIYIIKTPGEEIVIGTDYIIFARNFSRRIGQVDASVEGVIAAANAKAYKITNGAIDDVTVISTGGYTGTVGTYTLQFAPVDEISAVISIDATVTDGTKPIMTVNPKIVEITKNTETNVFTGITVTDLEDGQITPTASPVLDITKTGVQVITYRGVDSDGNAVEGTRTYVVSSAEEPAVVGDEYVIFASSFIKRLREVDTAPSAIVTAANARAFKLTDGTSANVNIESTGGYSENIGTYDLKFNVVEEPATFIVVTADVVDNEASEILVENKELTYEKGTKKTEEEFINDVSVQLIFASNLTTDFAESVDVNKVGTYEVTLTADVDFTNNVASASFINYAESQISTTVVVHIVDTTETTTTPGGGLVPTGENINSLLLIGMMIMILSTLILLLISILRKRQQNKSSN